MDEYRPNYGYQPCLNCANFHYGRCYHPVRQCWCCGAGGHIQRYCPRKERNRRDAPGGEALLGTRLWCEMHGLNQDTEMKTSKVHRNMINIDFDPAEVLDTLKVFPGAAIFINNSCILPGKEVYLSHNYHRERRYERPLADRIIRARSRSPSRERDNRRRERSRTPLRRSNSVEAFRLRQNTQYQSNAVVFEANNTRQPLRQPLQRNPFGEQNNQRTFGVSEPRATLQQYSENATTQKAQNMPATRPALAEVRNVRVERPVSVPFGSQYRQEEWIEDPYFVLGVENGASKEEIAYAFEQRTWEIDQQRMGVPSHYGDKWSSSVRMLEAAKRQLVGHY